MSGGGTSGVTSIEWGAYDKSLAADAVPHCGKHNFGWWKCAHCGSKNPYIKEEKEVTKCTQCGAPPK